MIEQNLPQRPTLFYRFLMLLLIPSLAYGLIALGVFAIQWNTSGGVSGSSVFRSNWINFLIVFIAMSMNVIVGFLIVRRAPGNVVGLLLIIFAMGMPGWLMPTEVNVVIESVARPFFAPLVFWAILCLITFFPTGRVYFRRLEPIIVTTAIVYVIGVFLGALSQPTASLVEPSSQPNLLFVPALVPLRNLLMQVELLGLCINVLILYNIVSIIPRYRRSSLRERQQLKWLAFGSAVFIVGGGFFRSSIGSEPNILSGVFALWSWLFPSITIGNAILRHHLYDIDIIIRRTLIYSVLTTILAAIYFGGIILTQQLFRATTGETPDIAIVLSTLLIVALFSPIRHRVQDVIDRRLYRRKYDVEKTLAQFQHNLRDEVDMDMLKANLISVVSETMQPDKIALWINQKPQP